MTSSVKPPLALKKRKLSSRQQLQPNSRLGADGENRAVAFLQAKPFKILDRNLRYRNCEVDIIALDLDTDELVFFEVKTRHQAYSDSAVAAVNFHKLRAMQQVAIHYLQERSLANDYRFDMISVLPSSIEHFENITWSRKL